MIVVVMQGFDILLKFNYTVAHSYERIVQLNGIQEACIEEIPAISF